MIRPSLHSSICLGMGDDDCCQGAGFGTASLSGASLSVTLSVAPLRSVSSPAAAEGGTASSAPRSPSLRCSSVAARAGSYIAVSVSFRSC
eukprot:COSAG03_NODE_6880_length_992_cov_1.234043_1_plen_89_part_10